MKRNKRLQFLESLRAGTQVLPQAVQSRISTEIREALRCSSVQPPDRRRLLLILHTTRVLDTTLKESALLLHCLSQNSHSLDAYLNDLQRKNVIKPTQRSSFKKQIVNPRNRFMHAAGAFPNGDREVNTILSAMEACFSSVLAGLPSNVHSNRP